MDAKELKELYGDRVIDKCSHKIAKFNRRTLKGCCPYHNDTNPSFSYYKSNLSFKCFSCGEVMDIYRYLEDFEGMDFVQAKKYLMQELNIFDDDQKEIFETKKENPFSLESSIKEVKGFPEVKNEVEKISSEVEEYMDSRGITFNTLSHFGVTGNKNHIFFNIRDDKGNLRNVKGRKIGDYINKEKGYFQTKNAMNALFGMHLIKDFDQKLYITEGEIDCMSMYQAGYQNTVSIPSGTSNFGWLVDCWDWLQKFSNICIYFDQDDAGKKALNQAVERLYKDRVTYVEYEIKNTPYKDANSILSKFGAEKLRGVIEKYERNFPIEGGIFFDDIKEVDDLDYSENIPTGIFGIDQRLLDPRQGQVVLLTGRAGTGKTTLLSQIKINAMSEGFNVFEYSGEMPAHRVKQWLYSQCAQFTQYTNKINLKYGRTINVPKQELKPFIDKHIARKFVLFDNEKLTDSNETILEIAERFVKKYSCKVVIIDNLMTSDFVKYGPAGNQNAQETGFIKAVVNFALKFNVLVYLVAHPRKTTAGASFKVDQDEISGSANIKNLVQTVLFLHQDKDSNSICSILKNREFQQIGDVPLNFCLETKQYQDASTIAIKKYKWIEEYEAYLQVCKNKKKNEGKIIIEGKND